MIKLGIPSDSPTAHYIKAKRLTKEEIIEKLTETAVGEIERIKYIKKLKKDNPTHPLLLAENFDKNGLRFQLLTFLNNVPGGYVYMLVPSAYGYYPVRLFTNLVKDTTDFKPLKQELKNLRDATDPSDIQKSRS